LQTVGEEEEGVLVLKEWSQFVDEVEGF